MQLDWTNPKHLDALKAKCPEGFDMIVGTDIIFNKTLVSDSVL